MQPGIESLRQGFPALSSQAHPARQSEGGTAKRSLLFAAVTGEEIGLLGSRYFAGHPTVALSSLAADLNMYMFLPLYPLHLLTVWGLREPDLGDLARRVSKSLDVEVQDDPRPQRNVCS